MEAGNANLFRCDLCPMTFMTESGVRRHLLCSHAHRYHRGRPSSPVPPALLDSAVSRVRLAQTNSRTRRRIRAMRADPPSEVSAAAGSDLDAFIEDVLDGWPEGVGPAEPPAGQRVVVREVETQHETKLEDAQTETEPPPRRLNVRSQAGPPALTGTALLVPPADQRHIALLSVSRPDLPPDRLSEWIRATAPEFQQLDRSLLESVVGVACLTARTFARQLLAEFRGNSDEPENLRAGFLAAYARVEETAERSTGPEY